MKGAPWLLGVHMIASRLPIVSIAVRYTKMGGLIERAADDALLAIDTPRQYRQALPPHKVCH